MLFLSYWELSENTSFAERLQIARHLTSSGLYPPEGVNILRWDITPDGWGITLAEAESAEDYGRSIDLWRASLTGIFEMIKTAPALPIDEAMTHSAELLEALGASVVT